MKGIRSFIFNFINFLNIICFKIDLVEGILGGKNVKAGEFTHQVAVLINKDYACGGAIIDKRHVLSAGQCVVDMAGNFLNVKFEILAGIVYLDSKKATRITRKVVYIYIKYEFRPPSRTQDRFPEIADLSILELDEDLPLGSNSILKKGLIPRRQDQNPYVYYEGNISGFGQSIPMFFNSASDLEIHFVHRRNSWRVMKYATVRVERINVCRSWYPNIQETHLCANSILPHGALSSSNPVVNEPTGACYGDVGGPLILDNGNIIGVLSVFSDGCDDRAAYGAAVYTNIVLYTEFIGNAVKNNFTKDMRKADYTGSNVVEIPHPDRS